VSWISSVSIVSNYRMEDRGSIPGRDEGIFPVVSPSRPALRAGAWRWPHTPSSVEVENEELYFFYPLAPAWRVTGQRFYHEGTASISSVYNIRNKIWKCANTEEEFRYKCGLKCVQKLLESSRRHFVICTPTPLVTTSSKYSRISILCSSAVFTKWEVKDQVTVFN
jgi:hypothetical protein